FKNSLVNMGFSELNMSFNENGKNKDDNQGQKNKNATKGEAFEDEQVQDSFEIVTPIYI
ncbi:MAG: flagellar hook-length control protein FliK, partial [Epsilonproteobacteria bacterium]|nr:flagellar hook-length control protein FliK [Campylobacterota bacterium]